MKHELTLANISAAPEGDESVAGAAKLVHETIGRHKVVDRDEDWGDVDLHLPARAAPLVRADGAGAVRELLFGALREGVVSEEMGVETVLDLRDADAETVRSRFSVVLERTVRELRGVPCLALEEMAVDKRQIMVSRSFGQKVHDLAALADAVATHTTRAAEKLRAQGSLAGAVVVEIRASPFSERGSHYQRSATVSLPEASADTRTLVRWAVRGLKSIFRPGHAYAKAGVMLTEIRPRAAAQGDLFSAGGSFKSEGLMAAMDAINAKWGRGSLRPAAVRADHSAWEMARGSLSSGYTTDWEGLPVVRAI